ncbi:MAG: FAD-binding oxidoreductase, partial [Acidobacteria bacterium]|nr:FAD-binding oxidoreductase [Acidobacteriota bacterium]
MSAVVQDIAAGLAALLGGSRVTSDPEACAGFAVDCLVPRCVVYPSSAEEAATTLRWAAEHELGVIPCRSATKLQVGNLPRRFDVALSLKGMNQVWHYEPSDLTLSVEPGMKFSDIQEFVGKRGLWLPLDPPGGGRASLGGMAATNAAGPLRLAYGAPRDIVLGMKIATTQGQVIKTGGRVVKNVTGYDTGKLLIGSYGTLGVIAEVSLKLFPLPPARATYVLTAGTLGIARDLRRRILSSPLTPARFVLLDGAVTSKNTKEPELWLEMHGSHKLLERAGREIAGHAAAAGAIIRIVDPAEADALWTRVTDIQSWISASFAGAIVLKATLPDSAVEELISRAEQEAKAEKAQWAVVAQLGVGIVHLCLMSEISTELQAALIRRLREATAALGGALIIERCPLP